MKPIGVAAWSMLTPFGEGDETIDALLAGRSAFTFEPCPWNLRNSKAAVIAGRHEHASDADWQRHLASAVCEKVLRAISIEGHVPCDRRAFIFATSFGHLLDEPGSNTMSTWARDCLLGLEYDVFPIVVGSGCSSGSDALGLGAAMLSCGEADEVVVVATDIVTKGKRLAHSTLGTMTPDEMRPFDVLRSGMLLGEASAAVALRRSEDCPEPLGELLGIGASNDATGLTAPDPSGVSVRLAIDRALRASGRDYDEISLYLAHGTATQLNDELEAKVLNELFPPGDSPTIVATKGALGHSLGACGVVEFILLLQMLERGLAPPTVGLKDPIDGIGSRFADACGRSLDGRCGISVTLGFGGFNTALLARA